MKWNVIGTSHVLLCWLVSLWYIWLRSSVGGIGQVRKRFVIGFSEIKSGEIMIIESAVGKQYLNKIFKAHVKQHIMNILHAV